MCRTLIARDVLPADVRLPLVEEIKGEWAVLDAGPCQLALHRVGEAYRVADPASWKAQSNAKLVMTVDRPLAELRAELAANGVPMGQIKSYPLSPGCSATAETRRATYSS